MNDATRMFGIARDALVSLRGQLQAADAGRDGMAATDAKAAMSILSDAQELVMMGADVREVLQMINRAKFFLGEIAQPTGVGL